MEANLRERENQSPSLLFADKCFDGVSGFQAKLFIGEAKLSIKLLCDLKANNEWTIEVKSKRHEQTPSIGCQSFSLTFEWKIVLGTSIDPHTLTYERKDGFLYLNAKQFETLKERKGLKRKEINTEFDDRNAKRFRAEVDEPVDEPQEEEPGTDLMNQLPFELIRKIIKSLNNHNEILKCALVNKTWRNAIPFHSMHTTLTIDDAFMSPEKYLDFIGTFHDYDKLPFTEINYDYLDDLNISQFAVLDFIKERGTRVKAITVNLKFKKHNGKQMCPLLEWVCSFKQCRYLDLQIDDYDPAIPIDYGTIDFSHIQEFVMDATIYTRMKKELQNRFLHPLQCKNEILHSYFC